MGIFELQNAAGEISVWYDDEGRLADEPQTNELATKLCGTYGDLVCDLVGAVMVTAGTTDAGETMPLSGAQAASFLELLRDLDDTPMPEIDQTPPVR